MISGTSHDGIDVALVDFTADGPELRGRVIDSSSHPYPEGLRDRIVRALPPREVPMSEVCELDTLIGQQFAEVAQRTLAGQPADLVCSHGQTMYHWVRDQHALGTLQLGQPAWIAESTGLPVISDVRSQDVAAGGHGAPLVSILDTLLLGDLPGRVAALNLGGISNVTLLGEGRVPVAYDVGPANALIDDVVRGMTGGSESYDRDGRYAASGTVDAALLADLLDEPYYALSAPKSTGKELFDPTYLAPYLARHTGVSGVDLVATVTALTAHVVAREVRREKVSTVVVSGGGVANPTLMAALRGELPGVAMRTTDEFGAAAETKEAIAFALIGYLTAHGLPGNVPSCTGASGPRVLGRVCGRPLVPSEVVAPRRLVLT